MADDTKSVQIQTIGILRLAVGDLRRLADLGPANAEAIHHIADECDRQIADLLKRLGIGQTQQR